MNYTVPSIQADLRTIVTIDQAGKELTVLDPTKLNTYAESLERIEGCSDEVRVLVRRVIGLNVHVKNPDRNPDEKIDWGFLVKVKMK